MLCIIYVCIRNYIFGYIASQLTIHFLEQTNYEFKEEIYSNDEDIEVDKYPEHENLHGTFSYRLMEFVFIATYMATCTANFIINTW